MERFFKKILIIATVLFGPDAFLYPKTFGGAAIEVKTLEIVVSTPSCDIRFDVWFCYTTAPTTEHLAQDKSSKLYCPSELWDNFATIRELFKSVDVHKPPQHALLEKLIDTHHTTYDSNLKKVEEEEAGHQGTFTTRATLNLTGDTITQIFLSTISFVLSKPIYTRLPPTHTQIELEKPNQQEELHTVKLGYYFLVPTLKNEECWKGQAYIGNINYLGNWFLLASDAKTPLEIAIAGPLGTLLSYTHYGDAYKGWISTNRPMTTDADHKNKNYIDFSITRSQEKCGLNIEAKTKPVVDVTPAIDSSKEL